MNTVATSLLDGRPVAVTGSDDDTVRVWDLTAREQLGEPLAVHHDGVLEMAIGSVDGRTVVATAGGANLVRVWDLATREQIGQDLVFPLSVGALAMAPGGRLLAGVGPHVTALTYHH